MHKIFLPLVFLGFSSAALGSSGAEAISPTAGLIQIVFGLVAVLGCMALAAWLVKKLGIKGQSNSATIQIAGAISVGNRERVMVLEIAGEWIVVGVTAQSINTLHSMKKPDHLPPQASAELPLNSFNSWLKQRIELRDKA